VFRFGSHPPNCSTFQLLTAEGMAVLDGRDYTAIDATKPAGDLGPFELKVIGYGPRGQQLVEELLALLAGWERAGRPSTSRLRLRVYSADYPLTPAPGEALVQKRWTKMLVDWPVYPSRV
jgi:hypothetical protein